MHRCMCRGKLVSYGRWGVIYSHYCNSSSRSNREYGQHFSALQIAHKIYSLIQLTNKTECERKFYVKSSLVFRQATWPQPIVRGHYIVSWCPANSEIVTRTGNLHRSFHNAWVQYRNRRSSGTTLRAEPAYKNKWSFKMLRCRPLVPYKFYPAVLGNFANLKLC